MKIHFIDTVDHIPPGFDYIANCGKRIESAEFPYVADIETIGRQELSGLNVCRECLAISECRTGTRYLYGMLPGAEYRKKQNSMMQEIA